MLRRNLTSDDITSRDVFRIHFLSKFLLNFSFLSIPIQKPIPSEFPATFIMYGRPLFVVHALHRRRIPLLRFLVLTGQWMCLAALVLVLLLRIGVQLEPIRPANDSVKMMNVA